MILGATNAISLCATEAEITGAASTPPHSHRHCKKVGWSERECEDLNACTRVWTRMQEPQGLLARPHTPTGTAKKWVGASVSVKI